MRRTSKVVVAATCAAMLVGLAIVSGQASSPPGTGGAAQPPPLSTKPFSQLFTPRADVELARKKLEIAREKLEAVRPGSARRFICGMPVLIPDSRLDKEFVKPLHDTWTRFSMREVPVPSCR